jgi:hypothetical protein
MKCAVFTLAALLPTGGQPLSEALTPWLILPILPLSRERYKITLRSPSAKKV